jgi:hypothetical protein
MKFSELLTCPSNPIPPQRIRHPIPTFWQKTDLPACKGKSLQQTPSLSNLFRPTNLRDGADRLTYEISYIAKFHNILILCGIMPKPLSSSFQPFREAKKALIRQMSKL